MSKLPSFEFSSSAIVTEGRAIEIPIAWLVIADPDSVLDGSQMGSTCQIPVLTGVAWLDDRPQCKHLATAWTEKQDPGTRCPGYGRRPKRAGQTGARLDHACPYGGLCAFADPGWIFKPGWDIWADHVLKTPAGAGLYGELLPGWVAGSVVAFKVAGDSMAPQIVDQQIVIASWGDIDFQPSDIAIVGYRSPEGIPLSPCHLKRVIQAGPDHWLICSDNAHHTKNNKRVPRAQVRIRAVILPADPALAYDSIDPLFAFSASGAVVPQGVPLGIGH